MNSEELDQAASRNIELARALGDRQSADSNLTGAMCTKIVNALLDSGNRLQVIARDGFTPTTKG